MRRVHRVTDPALAKALAAPCGGSYLAPFFERPCSAQEAVDYLDEPMSKVHHWVKRWLTLGALEIVERQPRAGRAITRYRTVADEFVVPEELLPASLLERQLTDLNREFLRGVFRAVPELEHRGSLRIHRQPGQRHVSVDRCPGRGAARSMLTHQSSMTLLLSQDEAKELVDDLLDLRDRWLERAGGEGRRPSIDGLAEHLVMLGTTPAAPRN